MIIAISLFVFFFSLHSMEMLDNTNIRDYLIDQFFLSGKQLIESNLITEKNSIYQALNYLKDAKKNNKIKKRIEDIQNKYSCAIRGKHDIFKLLASGVTYSNRKDLKSANKMEFLARALAIKEIALINSSLPKNIFTSLLKECPQAFEKDKNIFSDLKLGFKQIILEYKDLESIDAALKGAAFFDMTFKILKDGLESIYKGE